METHSPDVYRAIADVMKAIGRHGIAKDRKNEQQGYKFRGIDEVLNTLNPLLSDAGLCILPRVTERVEEERTTQKGGLLLYVTVCVEFDFVSVKDGSKHTVVMYGQGMDSADKATNKAMSAAFKYAAFQVFCIPTEGMDDADAHTPEPAPRAARAESPRPEASTKPWSGKFRSMYDALGPQRYSQILGNYGYERANDIPDESTARRIIDLMNEAAGKVAVA